MQDNTLGEVGIFISYSHADRYIAETIASRLREIGYLPWVDFAGIRGGGEWKRSIETALLQSAALLALLTPEAVTSEWVNYEIRRARANGLVIVPLMMRTCPMPDSLRDVQYIDFRTGLDQPFKELQRALLRAVLQVSDKNAHDTKPLKPVQADKRASLTMPVMQPPDQPMLLALVIEDVASTQEYLRDLLMDKGLEVHVAGTANEAATNLRKHNYAFITLDMQLGPDDTHGQGGVSLLSLIKRYQGDVPVVIISSLDWDKNKTAEFFVDGGIKHMLDKPVNPRQLHELVEKYVTGAWE
jgi:CheY-like chemotaxis protein